MDVARFFLQRRHPRQRGAVPVSLTALSDVDEVIDALKGTPYSMQLEKVLGAYMDANSIAVLERALEDYVMRTGARVGFRRPARASASW